MSENGDIHLKNLVDQYAKLYMEIAYSSGMPAEKAEDIVQRAFRFFFSSSSFRDLNEEETKIVIAGIVKSMCRELSENGSECMGGERINGA